MVIELKPHQQKAVDDLQNGSILVGGTGVGKTITALVYFYTKVCGGVVGDPGSMRTPRDIYVITTAKKRDSMDWQGDGAQMYLGEDQEASAGGIKLTVDSWNNIDEYIGVENAFFVFDEQRAVGKGKWSKSFVKIAQANKWIMLSATPGDTWMDYIPVFLAHGWYKNRTEFISEHVQYKPYRGRYPQIDKFLDVNRLVKQRNRVLVEMPYERHTVRHEQVVETFFDEELFEKVYKKRWHVYEDRPLNDAAELFSVMRKVVNSHTSRLASVRKLSSQHPKLIVFYNFDYELEILRTLGEHTCPPWRTDKEGETRVSGVSNLVDCLACRDVVIAEYNGHKHQDIPDSDSWIYLVQYTAGAESWNCITTDTIIFYSLNYSYKITHQSKGRIDRMNTPFTDLNYYILKSKSVIDSAIFAALRQKRNFNEKNFIREAA